MEETTLKQKLIDRFVIARDAVEDAGVAWRKALINANPYYDTYEGGNLMNRASSAVTDSARIGIEKIDRIVRDLEKIVPQLEASQQ